MKFGPGGGEFSGCAAPRAAIRGWDRDREIGGESRGPAAPSWGTPGTE
jgi:hypothetical protein